MKHKANVRQMVVLAMLSGVLLVLSWTPLGYLNIGPLAISLNMIPVAVAAMAAGPAGGAFLGAIFGITSCLQCLGIGGTSAMGVILFEIHPLFCFLQRLLPRILAGWLSGLAYRALKTTRLRPLAPFATGFAAAALNTVLFMAALVLLFGWTEYLQGLIAGRSILLFVCSFVGINALVELAAATAVVGAIGKALEKTHFIGG